MNIKVFAAAVVAMSAVAPLAHAGDDDAKVTGLAGGAATGAVLGGPVGAVIGGAVGLTTGAAIDDSNKTKTVIIKKQQPTVVIERQQPDVEIQE